MARRLDIVTVTLSKSRSIIKLPDDVIDSIARLLDKKIMFEVVYQMSGLRFHEIKLLVGYIDKSPDKKVDVAKLRELGARAKGGGLVPMLLKV